MLMRHEALGATVNCPKEANLPVETDIDDDQKIVDQAADLAWARALKHVPNLALLAASGSRTREALRRNVVEGYAAGIRDPIELADHALRTSSSKLLRSA